MQDSLTPNESLTNYTSPCVLALPWSAQRWRMDTVWALTLLGFCGLLQLSTARRINCTVSLAAGQTTYNVADVPRDPDCDYSWTSAGNLVLANNVGKNSSLVRENSISSLVTVTCFAEVNYTRRCVSEVTECSSECAFDCTGHASLTEEKYGRYGWIVAVIIVLLVLIGVVCFWIKDKITKKACSFDGITQAWNRTSSPYMADVDVGTE